MKIELLCVGKTRDTWVKAGMREYSGRMEHYTGFLVRELTLPARHASLPIVRQMEEEGKMILRHVTGFDRVILLDEGGREMGSVAFSEMLQQLMNRGTRKLLFVTGGAHGFSEEVYAQFTERLSLSQMTFSHQMVRLFFTEQLYRAFTILRGEGYHHR
jgi:23S rRNA (pseudouridine1915-N3)-methyltransferase